MEDIGFFDLNLFISYGEGEVVLVGKKLYYRNIILFTKRIEDLAIIKRYELVRANLNTCLRKIALVWYIFELSYLERISLRHDSFDGFNS